MRSCYILQVLVMHLTRGRYFGGMPPFYFLSFLEEFVSTSPSSTIFVRGISHPVGDFTSSTEEQRAKASQNMLRAPSAKLTSFTSLLQGKPTAFTPLLRGIPPPSNFLCLRYTWSFRSASSLRKGKVPDRRMKAITPALHRSAFCV